MTFNFFFVFFQYSFPVDPLVIKVDKIFIHAGVLLSFTRSRVCDKNNNIRNAAHAHKVITMTDGKNDIIVYANLM